jgi:hypothetical protein
MKRIVVFLCLLFILQTVCLEAFPAAKPLAAWEQFKQQYGNHLRVYWNEKTNTPRWIAGVFYPKELVQGDIGIDVTKAQQLVETLINIHSELFQINAANLRLRLANQYKGLIGLHYHQTYQGIPVYGTNIHAAVDSIGRIFSIGVKAYPDIQLSTIVSVTSEDAARIAEAALLKTDKLGIVDNSLTILPLTERMPIQYVLTWRVHAVSLRPAQSMAVFVDANNGQIVYQEDLMEKSVSGTVIQSYYHDVLNSPQHEIIGYVHTGFIGTYTESGQKIDDTWTDSLGDFFIPNPNSPGLFRLYAVLSSYTYVHHEILFQLDEGDLTFEYNMGPAPEENMAYLMNVFWHTEQMREFFAYDNVVDVTCLDNDTGDNYVGQQNSIVLTGCGTTQPDWIRHEYTHVIFWHLYGDEGISHGLSGDAFLEANVMDEAVAFYYSCRSSLDPYIEPMAQDISEYTQRYPDDWTFGDDGEKYSNAKILVGAMWDLWELIGWPYDEIMWYPFNFEQPTSLSTYLDSIYYWDSVLYDSEHFNEIYTAFTVNHGIEPTPTSFTMTIQPDINVVSLPLNPGTPWTLQDLLSKTQTDYMFYYDGNEFQYYGGGSTNIPVEGGVAYVVVRDYDKPPVDVTFTGVAWKNTPQGFEIPIYPDINMVGVPLDPGEPWTLEDLLLRTEADYMFYYDYDIGDFQYYGGGATSVPVEGGVGYVVVRGMDNPPISVMFEGVAWENNGAPGAQMAPAASPPQSWTRLLALVGQLQTPLKESLEGISLCIQNTRTQRTVVVKPLEDGSYQFVFSDFRTPDSIDESVIAAGDILTVTIDDANGIYQRNTFEVAIDIEHTQKHRVIVPSIQLSTLPNKPQLFENFPNPFNPDTWIPYQLSESAQVVIKIYNAQGQLIRELDLGRERNSEFGIWNSELPHATHPYPSTHPCPSGGGEGRGQRRLPSIRCPYNRDSSKDSAIHLLCPPKLRGAGGLSPEITGGRGVVTK